MHRQALSVLGKKITCDMKTNFYFSGEAMRKPANLITLFRIVLSIALLFLPTLSVVFGILYLLGGVSDMADGFVARKTHTESKTGAKLDSAADLLFVTVSAVKLLPLVRLNTWLWIWGAAIALIKIAAMVLRFVRVHTFMPPHSIPNKLTGVLLFLLPLTLPLMDIRYPVALVCAVATFAAVQDSLSLERSKLS